MRDSPNVSEGFTKWRNIEWIYPVFQFFPTRGVPYEIKNFPESPLFSFNVFPRQEWSGGFYSLSRGLLRLGDDSLDKDCLSSKGKYSFVCRANCYSIFNRNRSFCSEKFSLHSSRDEGRYADLIEQVMDR